MDIWQAVVLGIVQGLTEFLPVSSSGHLVLLGSVFGVQENLLIAVALHFGSLVAVLFAFRKEVVFLIKHPFCDTNKKLVLATIPTVVIVLFFKTYIEDSFSGNFFLIGFVLTAFLLMLTDILQGKGADKKPIRTKSAILLGIAQGVASLPGVSRSGSTICTGILLGENRETVANFSFLMSIPIIVASCIYEMCFGGGLLAFDLSLVVPVLVGMAFAFISGLFAIKIMLKAVKRANLYIFAIYLVALVIVLSLLHLV